jgi:hypothetical protein
MSSSEQGLNGFVPPFSILRISIFTTSGLFSDCECNLRQTEKNLLLQLLRIIAKYNMGKKKLLGHWTAKYTRMLTFSVADP